MRKLLLIICTLFAFNAIARENYGKLRLSGFIQSEVEDALNFQADYSYMEFVNENIYLSAGAGLLYSNTINETIRKTSSNSLSICTPINIGYRIKTAKDFDLDIYTGVQLDLLLFGYYYDQRYDKAVKDYIKEINPFSLSYNIGVSLNVIKKFGIFAEYNRALSIGTFGTCGNNVSNYLQIGLLFTFE